MNTAVKLATFAAAVAATFGGALAVGAAVGPIEVGSSDAHGAHSVVSTGSADLPRGLAIAEAGYRLVLASDIVSAGAPATFSFEIVDDEGEPVTGFQQLHDRPLHLIVVSRDLIHYLHLHPTMDAAGEWTVQLPALAAGSYRVFADFQPEGAANLTLGGDLLVPGPFVAAALPAPASVAETDGDTVMLTGSPAVGAAELTFAVEHDGQVVRTDPYLGAAGHLVAIRNGDLAYLHVHPHDDSGPAVTFTGEFPSAGTYRLFFDFSTGGTVHTAAFTVVVPDAHDTGAHDTGAHDEPMTTHSDGH